MVTRDPTREILRGLTLLEMTFVNISQILWTRHSDFIGHPTYADTVFPCFIFIAGMTRNIPRRRSIGLVGIGLALNAVGALAQGTPLRLPGVLQRHGLASLLFNEPRLGYLRDFGGLPLIAIWYLVSIVFVGSPELFPEQRGHAGHLRSPSSPGQDWRAFDVGKAPVDTDPEGLLGVLTTTVSMMIGSMFVLGEFGESLGTRMWAATALIAAGETLHVLLPQYAPLSKKLWTPSFVLVTSGISMLKYLFVESLARFLPRPIRNLLSSLGRRSLETYVFSSLLQRALACGGPNSLMSRSVHALTRFTSPAVADLLMSTLFTVANAFAAMYMDRHAIKLSW